MQVLLVAVVVGALTAFAEQVVQKPAASAGSDRGRDADRAAIEKLKQQDVVATVARDAVAMADLWTDDAVRLGPDTPAEVGRQAIRETNERSTALPIKVLRPLDADLPSLPFHSPPPRPRTPPPPHQ